MQIQNSKEAEYILSELQASGLSVTLTDKSSLRIKGEATEIQIETCRRFKTQIIEALSLHCSNCALPMQIIDNGNLWFCPLGCESQKVNQWKLK
jgi:hypothetical protein